ncbi:MAG: serine protease, partial [Candidatus Atribacteria bacterium]|nr:serine protease [Candidatus Atribacteria bacterium]
CILIILVMIFCFITTGWAEGNVQDSIVKVYAVYDAPDYYNPWNMQGPQSVTGSGAIIQGNRILTNAHVVSDVTFLQVRRHGETQRYPARVVAISHQVDLALLEVDDSTFFQRAQALEIGELPETHQEVYVYGFPMGGDTLSITKGIISRIEHQPYVHSSIPFLAGQIDAAINPGNSGGPVILDGKIVGVIMQGIPNAQNIGYMVPAPIVTHFFDDIKDGKYDGFPNLGITMEYMENPDLRKKYQMPDTLTGILVTEVYPGSPAQGKIQPEDVLLCLDDFTVANDGTVEFRPQERTSLSYVVQKHQIGDPLAVKLLRNGKELPVQVTLNTSADDTWLISMEQYEALPSYFIYGGIVFSPLTMNLFTIWGPQWYDNAPKELVALLSNNIPEVMGEQVVLVLRILPADINDGYQDVAPWIVDKVNSKKIWNMKDLVKYTEEDDSSPYTIFENTKGQKIVLDREKVKASKDRLFSVYKIRDDRSADLKL